MTLNRRFFLFSALAALSACASSKFRRYNGPEVTQVVVNKGQRQMYLMNGNRQLKKYKFDLGFAPAGHKQVEGDGRTPEGVYFIDRRNPESRFHLSLGISYPNEQDRFLASQMGKSPGGDIFIHGRGPFYNLKKNRKPDWTWGCISISDREVEDVYAMVKTGTPIVITA
ncbi:murein L,D-transpeptidase family protein [Oceaniovalibus sp. ACAM 378]|jgi:murein L,D-transpeptidase YafK|uniref:L,D-transpeptidase family protein n=1 Tax=Oceaniovalibus sp. ACAM 378 TaxID=2599923 RepID=UPI0011D7B15F|nr:L,D-transpeptidase family protein [Oceaniovalibus sp. ACAM 378]TYB86409.1 L,D-transpeptidase family protein [Oceaniovalibus sp. ACAM 378]